MGEIGFPIKLNSSSPPFEYNICFDTAQDTVVSKCGHLYCWPSIFKWMNHRPVNPTFLVCKGAISKDTLTPIYCNCDFTNVLTNITQKTYTLKALQVLQIFFEHIYEGL